MFFLLFPNLDFLLFQDSVPNPFNSSVSHEKGLAAVPPTWFIPEKTGFVMVLGRRDGAREGERRGNGREGPSNPSLARASSTRPHSRKVLGKIRI